jgi:hypothetical protein
MAAVEMFESFLKKVTEKEGQPGTDLIAAARTDLFAARSEEARLRIVNDFIKDAHDLARLLRR